MGTHKLDDGDRRTNEVWSTGRAMAYGYDDAHQLVSVVAARPSDAARYRYDAAGNPVDRAELGLDVTNTFNNLNQIVTGSWTGSTVTVAGSVNYPVGSISVNNTPGTVYPDCTFDIANVPAVPGTNTLTATYTGPAYTNAPMTATDTSTIVLGDTAYTHDPNGNLTSDATLIYQYDLANQLTNVTRKADNTVVLQCRYDALGRRVEAIRSDGTVDRYVYFPGSFLVLAVLDETNAPKEFYTRGPDLSGTLASAGGIGGILACTYSNAPTSPLFHHADLMGNIVALTDTCATLAATFCYTPFGQLTAYKGILVPRHLFSSKEGATDMALIYYGLRFYLSNHSCWITPDCLGERGGINLYQFLKNNPLENYDALGLKWVIRREGQLQATATVDCDTIASLAKQIGLSEAEYKQWLVVDDNRGFPSSSVEKICNRSFKIPNAIYALWGGHLGKMGKTLVSWHKGVQHLRDLGFRVLEFGGQNYRGQKPLFNPLLTNAVNNKVLHGLYFWGHGDDTGVLGTKIGTLVDIPTLTLPYKLAFVALYGCDTATHMDEISSGTPGGISCGYEGTLWPLPNNDFLLDGLIFTGAQGTR